MEATVIEKTRCQKIYTSVHTLYSSDITTITSKMPKIIQTTVDCYAGSCKNCRRHAVVCRGGLQNNWWHKSQYLKASGMTWLNMTDGHRLTLQGLIEMRLGNAALQIGILQSARCAAENSDVGIDPEYVTSILGSACFWWSIITLCKRTCDLDWCIDWRNMWTFCGPSWIDIDRGKLVLTFALWIVVKNNGVNNHRTTLACQ